MEKPAVQGGNAERRALFGWYAFQIRIKGSRICGKQVRSQFPCVNASRTWFEPLIKFAVFAMQSPASQHFCSAKATLKLCVESSHNFKTRGRTSFRCLGISQTALVRGIIAMSRRYSRLCRISWLHRFSRTGTRSPHANGGPPNADKRSKRKYHNPGRWLSRSSRTVWLVLAQRLSLTSS